MNVHSFKQEKKSNKKFKNFRVIITLCNYHFIILNLFWAIKGFILYQIKQTALIWVTTLQLLANSQTTIEKLQTSKPLSPISTSSSISRKRQVTGFEPLRHIYYRNIHFGYLYSTSSSPLLLRGATDTAQILCLRFNNKYGISR